MRRLAVQLEAGVLGVEMTELARLAVQGIHVSIRFHAFLLFPPIGRIMPLFSPGGDPSDLSVVLVS